MGIPSVILLCDAVIKPHKQKSETTKEYWRFEQCYIHGATRSGNTLHKCNKRHGGERQRICNARATRGKPAITIREANRRIDAALRRKAGVAKGRVTAAGRRVRCCSRAASDWGSDCDGRICAS